MFDSSDDEDGANSKLDNTWTGDRLHEEFSLALCNAVYVELMKMKAKVPVYAASKSDLMIDKETAIILPSNMISNAGMFLKPTAQSITELQDKIRNAKIKNVKYFTIDEFQKINTTEMFDIISLLIPSVGVLELKLVSDHLMPKGLLVTYDLLPQLKRTFSDNDWLVSGAIYREVNSTCSDARVAGAHLVCISKRAAHCNQAGALYWSGLQSPAHVALEKKLIEEVSVTLSAQEVKKGVFNTVTHDSAVRIIQQYGVCIFPRLFAPGDVLQWGQAARADMLEAIQRLRVSHQVDLLAPDVEGEVSDMPNVVRDNFHELSMREAYRCDLRNSPRMKTLHDYLPRQLAEFQMEGIRAGSATTDNSNYVTNAGATAALSAAAPVPGGETKASKINAAVHRCVAARASTLLAPPTSTTAMAADATLSPTPEMRYNRGLLGVLTETMNPVAPQQSALLQDDVNIEHGNWGKWNFSGPGPGSFNGPCIGKTGTIVSLPGCKDQTIHADTPHIFEHVHLPGHYLNLFMPSVLPSTAGGDAPLTLDMLTPTTVTAAAAAATKDAATKGLTTATTTMATSAMDTEEEEVYVDEEAVLRAMLQTNCELPDGPTPSTCYLQGQTAFVVGTHQMSEAAIAMTHADAQQYLEARLIRPQLTSGDALLFDCRVLHFGLANWSHLKRAPVTEKDWRMMLYVNYHQQWFQDPKNWNDAQRLFK